MAQPIFSLASDSYSSELEITAMSGTESISSFFELKITFKIKNDIAKSLDHSLLTQEQITLTIDDTIQESPYVITGMFHEVEELFEASNTHKFYTGVMVPTLWRQRKNQSYDIYVDKTAEDIISDELSNDLMLDHHLSLSQTYPQKEFVCQYSESNFNFVSRIAEHWGIYYYFDHYQEGRLVFADDTNYEPLPIGTIALDESNNPTHSFSTIRTLRRKYNSVPDAVIISETNPDQAMELFQGIAGDPSGDKTSVTMADEGADNKDEADLLAQIRLEELSTYKVVFSGTSGIPNITPGFVLTISTPSGDEHEILITHVSHSGNNLDDPALAAGKASEPYYECTFTGIPKDTQYRPERKIKAPNVVSTTGRVYSAANDQTLAQRNEVGKYQVTFDFMRGEEDKISNWIRHASHSARSNHLDIPLTPGTEVQIGFIGGNPNRPYILNALENSQSVLHPVTHENPHHAALITDGMLYTGALKSRQSLHITADLDPAEVKEHINNHPLKRLNKDGTDSGNPVDTIKGDVHISRTYGERYQWREGVDFNYGLNATYNFGQQYVENHAYQDTVDGENFDISGELDSFDESVSSIVRSDLQHGLAKEREVGFVQKDFGNKYNYHEGHSYNWSAGTNGNGIQKTFNFGSSYVENHTANNDSSELINNPSSGFPSAPNLNTDLITKTTGNTFDWQEGNKVEVHIGNLTSEMKGEIEENIIGNITSSNTGNIDETINGDITTTHTGNVTETLTGDQTITLMGNIIENHNQGDVTFNRVGATTDTYVGTKTSYTLTAEFNTAAGLVANNFHGGYANLTTLVALDTFAGGKVETHHGPKVINQVNEIIVTKSDIKKGISAISKYTSNIINSAITMIG